MEKLQERTERGIKSEIAGNRQESAEQARGLREEVLLSLNLFKESQDKRFAESAAQLQQQFESFGRRLSDFGQTGQENAKQARGAFHCS
ncbi:MAG: hypothetical protein B7Z37_23015 [Verrucomicrobia bacterium 12-59-8]|nr:MAG: hypothetical protein B7Z37_23015 [Verrucomicrobia bacterium 12-59-8]